MGKALRIMSIKILYKKPCQLLAGDILFKQSGRATKSPTRSYTNKSLFEVVQLADAGTWAQHACMIINVATTVFQNNSSIWRKRAISIIDNVFLDEHCLTYRNTELDNDMWYMTIRL